MQSHNFFSLEQIIDRQPLTVTLETPLVDAIASMQNRGNSCRVNVEEVTYSNSSCVLIVEGRQLRGIFTERDLVKLIAADIDLAEVAMPTASFAIAEVMIRDVVTLTYTGSEDIFTALDLLRSHRIRHLPIVDPDNNLLGLTTVKNLRQKLQPINMMKWRKVAEVMMSRVFYASPDDSIRRVAKLMATNKISCVAITKTEVENLVRPIGIITERDIVQCQNLNLDLEQPASKLMSAPLFLVSPEDDLWQVHQQMQQRRVRRLLVAGDRGELAGIVTQTSLLQVFDPAEVYEVVATLRKKVYELEADKAQLLENRQAELETEIEQRTAALESSNQRLQLEANLRREGEQRYNSILSSLEDLVWSVEPDTFRVIYMNSAAERIYQRPLAEFYDDPNLWLEVVHLEDRDRVAEFAQTVLAAGSAEIEYRIIRPDGEVRWLYDRATVICNESGTPIRLDGIATDISDRKRTELALQESQERYTLAVEGSSNGLWDWNIPTDEVFYSPRFKAMIGYSNTEMPNVFEAWSSKLHSEDRERVLEAIKNHLEQRVPYDIEYRLRTKQGQYLWFQARGQAIWNEAGEAVRMAGSITDISDRQQSETALRESEQKFRNMADNAPMMVWVTDETGKSTYVSKSWCEFTGQTEEIALRFGWLEAVHPDDRERAEAIFLHANDREEAFQLEYRVRRHDGEYRWAIDAAKPWIGNDGQFKGYIGSVIDISDRKRREAILKDIASGISVEVGESFFHSLTAYLSRTLQVDFTFICKLIDSDKDSLQTLAAYGRGETIENFAYQIANAPCGDAIERGLCIYPEAVRQHFPNVPPLEAMSAESYAGMPISAPTGEVIGLIGIVHTKQFSDLRLIEEVLKIFATRATAELERQQAEEKIREQAALLDLTHDTILVRNLENIITYWNLGASEMYGWLAAEALGKQSHELLRAKFSQSLTEIEAELFQEDHWEGEIIHQKRDGSNVIVMGRWSLLRDRVGNPQQILEINHDITKRKQAEAKIQEQAALLDIANDAIMVRDSDDQILFWNRGAEKLYGWSKAEALNRNAKELFNRKSTIELSKIHQAVRERGEWQGELNQVTKAGKEVVVNSRWTLVKDEVGDPQTYLVVKTDITEQKQLEAQFLRTQRLESLGTLAGGIAHDLNNILAPILGFAKLLPLKLSDADEQTKGFLKIMETNAQRGTALVKQILTFSRGMEGERGIVQIRHLINEIAQIVRETFPKSIELTLNVPKTLWTVNGDVNQLHQVLMNLCVNARDAMPDGGKLIIEAENFTVDREYARLHLDAAEGNYLCITVTDTGVGIPPEIIDRIFEPFFTTKEIGRGTGLGLSTVIGIVKSHDGFIDVVSKTTEKRGTRVNIFIPASDAASAIAESNKSLTRGNGELILVVDDETPMLEVTKATLETYNYRVLTAKNGIEAVAAYANNQEAIALIIMDIMMPGMDGKTAIRTLKQIDSQVRVLAVSGLITNREIFNELDEEVIAFLSKPYSNEELLETVHEIVSG